MDRGQISVWIRYGRLILTSKDCGGTIRSPRIRLGDHTSIPAPIKLSYWRYNYRFNGKQKTVALDIYPDVSLAKARARHQEARHQLANDVDPSTQKRAFGKIAFEIRTR